MPEMEMKTQYIVLIINHSITYVFFLNYRAHVGYIKEKLIISLPFSKLLFPAKITSVASLVNIPSFL